MIIWLNQTERRDSTAPPLHRIGVLKGKNYPIHRSFDHIAFSLFTGNVQVSLKDQDGKVLIDRPACVLALPGDVRELRPLRPVDEFYFVYAAEHLATLLPEEELERYPQKFKVMPLEDCPMVPEYAEVMKKILSSPIGASRAAQLDLLAELILRESFLNARQVPPPSSGRALREIENYIHTHYHDNLDWEKISLQHGISYSTFRQLWSRMHSNSPHHYVMELRNREACELLKDRSLPVSRIARLVGYEDPRYFSRFFQRLNGVSPVEFRRKEVSRGSGPPGPGEDPRGAEPLGGV